MRRTLEARAILAWARLCKLRWPERREGWMRPDKGMLRQLAARDTARLLLWREYDGRRRAAREKEMRENSDKDEGAAIRSMIAAENAIPPPTREAIRRLAADIMDLRAGLQLRDKTKQKIASPTECKRWWATLYNRIGASDLPKSAKRWEAGSHTLAESGP